MELKGFYATRGNGDRELWIIENDAPIHVATIIRQRTGELRGDGNYTKVEESRVIERLDLMDPFNSDRIFWIDGGGAVGARTLVDLATEIAE